MRDSKAWQVQLNERIAPSLSKHGKAVVVKIKAALNSLKTTPKKGKQLKHPSGVRSLSVTTPSGEFRVLYRLDEDRQVITVDFIETREKVYKILKRSG